MFIPKTMLNRVRMKDIKVASVFLVLYSFIVIYHLMRYMEDKDQVEFEHRLRVNDEQLSVYTEPSASEKTRQSQLLDSVVQEILTNRDKGDDFRVKRDIRAGLGLSRMRDEDVDLQEDEKDVDPPGHMGAAVEVDLESLTDAEFAEMEEGWKRNSFNQFVSDKIPLDRALPDIRHKDCQDHESEFDLPSMSVIICFHNEAFSTLLRTVHSVLKHTPAHLLVEVILVDDFSDMDHLKDRLTRYTAQLPKVRLIRTDRREGLVRARLLGTRAARAGVLTFLDSHCECFYGWAQPLMERIKEDPTIVPWPAIQGINKETFEILRDVSVLNKGGFYWDLHYRWVSLTFEEYYARSDADPLRSPTMPGGLFAISKQFFEYLGTYDPQFEYWGGENMELSFKVWMCGGSLELIPCSRVAHVYRDVTPMQYDRNLITINAQRVADVWMDEYKDIFYESRGIKCEMGDLSSRHELRQKLNCKSFDWYLKTIVGNMFVPTNAKQRGKVHPFGRRDQCLDQTEKTPPVIPVRVARCSLNIIQTWYLTEIGELRTSLRCLDIGLDESRKTVPLGQCHGGQGNQYWEYTQDSQLRSPGIDGCLTIDYLTLNVHIETCNSNKRNQKWIWQSFAS